MGKNYRPKTCPICQAEFIPTTSNQKYCFNPRCKQLGHNALVRKIYAQRKSVRNEPALVEDQKPEPLEKRRYTLPEVNAMARDAKTSYGKFVLDKDI